MAVEKVGSYYRGTCAQCGWKGNKVATRSYAMSNSIYHNNSKHGKAKVVAKNKNRKPFTDTSSLSKWW